MKQVHCAVGILHRDRQVLLSQRQSQKMEGGAWEFPGGKIESMETPYQALVRELEEEVGVKVETADHLMRLTHDYELYVVTLEIFLVSKFTGSPFGKENQAIQWASLPALENLYIPTPNLQIIARLKEHFAKL